jgi:zinc transporter
MTPKQIELPDTRGLISAFLFRPGEPQVHIGWAEIARLPEISRGGLAWLHFNLTDVRAREWITRCRFLPPEAAEIVLAADSRIRLERIGEGIAGVLGDLHHDFDADPESIGLIRLYADDGLLITGRRHPLRAIDRLRREMIAGASIGTPIALLVHLLGHLAETFESLIGELVDQVDAIEDRILAGRFHEQGSELGRVRRLTSRIRRHLNAERHALAGIVPRLPAWCGEADAADLRGALDRLDSIGQDLDLLYERGRLLQEEIGNRLGEATNRNLYLLSIVTAIFLPMTLVTGLFGSNVGGMPWIQEGLGFWWVLLVMGATAIIAILLLRWWRLF